MDDTGISLKDFLHTLRRHKFHMLLAIVLSGAIAVAISQGMPAHYTSEALLEVEAHSPLTRELDPAVQATTPDQVRTEVDILQSRALADSVVRELHLADAPDFKAAVRAPTWIDRITLGLHNARAYVQDVLGLGGPSDPIADTIALFRRRLSVQADEKTHIVAVYFQSGSPQLSADVVNTLLAKYLSNQVAANLGVTAQENQWLNEHLAALQREVDQAAAKAQAFRQANGLVDIQAGTLSAIQLNEKEQNLSNARQELARAQAAYDTAVTASKTGSGFVGQEALGSELIQRLREREAEVLQRIANMKQRDGENSLYMRPVMAELDSIHRQIANETNKIVSALGLNVSTAQIRVNRLEVTVADAQEKERRNGGSAARLAQLNQDTDAKRHVYNAFLTRMEQTQLTSTKFPSARVVSPAVPSSEADGTPLLLAAIMGTIVGAFLSIATILLRYVLARKVSSTKDIEYLTGLTPIGSVPAARRILDMKGSNVVETLHAVSFAIQTMSPGTRCTRVLVTSSMQQEGKTTLAVSLARLSAANGMRVLLVEADLRRPALGRMLRFESGISIESVLSEGHRLADAVQIDPESGLHCLTASGSAPNVVKALQSAQFGRLMDEAQGSYDMVIMDSPPMMLVVDPRILSKYSDVILFAVAFGRTPATVVAEAFDRFPFNVRSRIATVLTRVPRSEAAWAGYYAGYQRTLAGSA